MADPRQNTEISFAGTFASSAFSACFAETQLSWASAPKENKYRGGAGIPKYRGMLGTVATIAREEGLVALWKGIVPGLHRQFLYGGLRIALYKPVKAFLVGSEYIGDVSLFQKILAAMITGALAIAVANPTDLVKVQLQAEGNLLPGVPKRYSGALNAYYTVFKQVFRQSHCPLMEAGYIYAFLEMFTYYLVHLSYPSS